MNQSGTTSGTGLYWFLSSVRTSKATAIVELKGNDLYLLFIIDGSLVLVESTNPASSFPAFLIGNDRLGKEDVMKSMECATNEGIPLPAALTHMTQMDQKGALQHLRDHGMHLLATLFGEAKLQYTVHLSPKPASPPPLMKIPIIFPYIKSFINQGLQNGEMRQNLALFDETLTPAPNYGPLIGGVVASMETPSAQALAKALGKGPVMLTEMVAKGCDAEEVFLAAKALVEAQLAFFKPGKETVGQWGYAFSLGTGFDKSPHSAPRNLLHDEEQTGGGAGPQSAPRPKPATGATSGSGDTAVEEALRESLQKLTEAEHHYGALGMPLDSSRAALEERLNSLDAKYADGNYSGFMLSANGENMLISIQEKLKSIRETFGAPEVRVHYHEKMGISDDDLRVPLAAIHEAESMAQNARDRVQIEAYEEAVTLMEQAAELTPHDAHRVTELALLIFEHVQKGNLDGEKFSPEVDAALSKAIGIDSKSAVPFRVKAMIMEARGRPADALDAYQKALEMNSRDDESRAGMRRMRKEVASSTTEDGDDGGGGDNVMSKLSGMLFRRT